MFVLFGNDQKKGAEGEEKKKLRKCGCIHYSGHFFLAAARESLCLFSL